MAEVVSRDSALGTQRLAQGTHKGATVGALAPASRFSFRGSVQAAALAGSIFGPALPVGACRASDHGERAALWLGPDEWLLLAPEAEETDTVASIAEAMGPEPYALVNISHRNVGLEITGPQAAALLAAGCPLDLHELAFPAGMCTRTILAKAEIILWRTASERFHLEVWRSFVPYVWDFLIEARTRL